MQIILREGDVASNAFVRSRILRVYWASHPDPAACSASNRISCKSQREHSDVVVLSEGLSRSSNFGGRLTADSLSSVKPEEFTRFGASLHDAICDDRDLRIGFEIVRFPGRSCSHSSQEETRSQR